MLFWYKWEGHFIVLCDATKPTKDLQVKTACALSRSTGKINLGSPGSTRTFCHIANSSCTPASSKTSKLLYCCFYFSLANIVEFIKSFLCKAYTILHCMKLISCLGKVLITSVLTKRKCWTKTKFFFAKR